MKEDCLYEQEDESELKRRKMKEEEEAVETDEIEDTQPKHVEVNGHGNYTNGASETDGEAEWADDDLDDDVQDWNMKIVVGLEDE